MDGIALRWRVLAIVPWMLLGVGNVTAENNCTNCVSDGQTFSCAFNMQTGFHHCEVLGSQSCMVSLNCGPSGGGCFLAGSMVTTPDGDRPIEHLKIGDQVISYNETAKRMTTALVVEMFRSLECEYIVINDHIEVTGTHPFWIDGGWVQAKDICLGDQFRDIAGDLVIVGSVAPAARGVRVYNIGVAVTHTFYVDGVLVHNKTLPGS